MSSTNLAAKIEIEDFTLLLLELFFIQDWYLSKRYRDHVPQSR